MTRARVGAPGRPGFFALARFLASHAGARSEQSRRRSPRNRKASSSRHAGTATMATGAGTPTAGRSHHTAALGMLRAMTRGEVVTPRMHEYDAMRRGYNAGIDHRPAAILRCVDESDVIAGIRFARHQGWSLSVRGSGHSLAGFGMCDGGLALDLSAMKSLQIEAARRTA